MLLFKNREEQVLDPYNRVLFSNRLEEVYEDYTYYSKSFEYYIGNGCTIAFHQTPYSCKIEMRLLITKTQNSLDKFQIYWVKTRGVHINPFMHQIERHSPITVLLGRNVSILKRCIPYKRMTIPLGSVGLKLFKGKYK